VRLDRRIYRQIEDYIVTRYSSPAGSLPSEKITNLQFSEGFPAAMPLCYVSNCPLLGRRVSPSGKFLPMKLAAEQD
jgi:hypothetical protein